MAEVTSQMTTAENTAPSAPGPARTVYFDHAATSWPKAPGVAEQMQRALLELGGNPGRGAYRMAVDTARAIHAVRRDAAEFLGAPDSKDLLFQPGCTQGLNLALFGLLAPGDRIVACPSEHNAVARPLNVLAQRGVEVVFAEPTEPSFLADLPGVDNVTAMGPTTLSARAKGDVVDDVVKRLAQRRVTDVRIQQASLEDVFLEFYRSDEPAPDTAEGGETP